MTTIRFICGREIDSFLRNIKGNDNNFDSFLIYILNLSDCEKEVKPVKKEFHRHVQDYISEFGPYNNE